MISATLLESDMTLRSTLYGYASNIQVFTNEILVYIPPETKVVAGYRSIPFGGFGTNLTQNRDANITAKLQNRYYTIFALMCVAHNAVTHSIRTYLKNIDSDLLPMVRVRLCHSRRLSEIPAIAFFSSHVTVKVNMRTDPSYNRRISHKFNLI